MLNYRLTLKLILKKQLSLLSQFNLQVYAEGYLPREIEFTVVEQHPTLLNVTLHPAKVGEEVSNVKGHWQRKISQMASSSIGGQLATFTQPGVPGGLGGDRGEVDKGSDGDGPESPPYSYYCPPQGVSPHLTGAGVGRLLPSAHSFALCLLASICGFC